MQSSYDSGVALDSAAMEISSISTLTSTSSGFNQFNSISPKRTTGLSVPPSPTPSVNKNVTDHESTLHEDMRSSTSHHANQVAFMRVKTQLLNLHDGFTWKKYGEKAIKEAKHTRNYFRCAESKRSGCNVQKHTQRCADDEEYVMFTYFGRHNHDRLL